MDGEFRQHVGRPPSAYPAPKTRAQTRIFRPPEQKVDVCARVLISVIPGAPVATKHCDPQTFKLECTQRHDRRPLCPMPYA